MRIVLSGGGTGGHITPILAVAHELKKQHPNCEIIYIAERGGKFKELTQSSQFIDRVVLIYAGKFRRYHGESFLKRLFDFKTNLFNLRDLFYFIIGTFQSVFIIFRFKPDAVFLKGGFVGVPVGLASVVWQRPFITHDSDALPGLANRIVGRWARIHATGLPADMYSYPVTKTRYVGVLVTNDYQPVDDNLQRSYKNELHIPVANNVLFVTGGSLGSKVLNKAVVKIVPDLLTEHVDLTIIHQVGKGNENTYNGFQHSRLIALPFLQAMHRYSGAADVIITRAGANTIAEFGIQGKACIVVPNPFLTGGHQLKNAEFLSNHKAALVIQEEDLENSQKLEEAINTLITDKEERQDLADELHKLAKPDAAEELARMLLQLAPGDKHV